MGISLAPECLSYCRQAPFLIFPPELHWCQILSCFLSSFQSQIPWGEIKLPLRAEGIYLLFLITKLWFLTLRNAFITWEEEVILGFSVWFETGPCCIGLAGLNLLQRPGWLWIHLTPECWDSRYAAAHLAGRGNFRTGNARAGERRGLKRWFQGYLKKGRVGVLLLVSKALRPGRILACRNEKQRVLWKEWILVSKLQNRRQ